MFSSRVLKFYLVQFVLKENLFFAFKDIKEGNRRFSKILEKNVKLKCIVS